MVAGILHGYFNSNIIHFPSVGSELKDDIFVFIDGSTVIHRNLCLRSGNALSYQAFLIRQGDTQTDLESNFGIRLFGFSNHTRGFL